MAKNDLISLYGKKLRTEAYQAIKSECIGASFRKHGGPLIRVISETDAEIKNLSIVFHIILLNTSNKLRRDETVRLRWTIPKEKKTNYS